ncbi:MAG: hypothetical protein QGI54_12310, partial [Gammaproteobacteria bacterium]|nr:hypothetical protein [Gammaproteobacteria bacterium]
TKIGTFTVADYSTSATTTVSGILFTGGVFGSSSTSGQYMADLTLTPITTPPANGANDSANGDDIYTVEVTATDANNATKVQTLNVTVAATTDTDHASVTSTWTGTSSADTFTIDEYSGLTITADGGDGGNDTAKLAVLDHVLWDTTSGGTTELAASLVDMEIIDIGAVLTTYDSSNAQSIADFSTHLLLDATSVAAMVTGSDHDDGAIGLYGTGNDMVTLDGADWSRTANDGTDSTIASGSDYYGETVDTWQLTVDSTTYTLYIDNDINVITPDL